MTAPDKIWANPITTDRDAFIEGEYYDERGGKLIDSVEYTRTDLSNALIAAAFEVAAGVCQQEAENSVSNGFPERGLEIVARRISALTPPAAQAALQAMIDDAVKEARAEVRAIVASRIDWNASTVRDDLLLAIDLIGGAK